MRGSFAKGVCRKVGNISGEGTPTVECDGLLMQYHALTNIKTILKLKCAQSEKIKYFSTRYYYHVMIC